MPDEKTEQEGIAKPAPAQPPSAKPTAEMDKCTQYGECVKGKDSVIESDMA